MRVYVYLYIYIYSLVGIAAEYGLDVSGSNPGGDENFRPSRPALGPLEQTVGYHGTQIDKPEAININLSVP